MVTNMMKAWNANQPRFQLAPCFFPCHWKPPKGEPAPPRNKLSISFRPKLFGLHTHTKDSSALYPWL